MLFMAYGPYGVTGAAPMPMLRLGGQFWFEMVGGRCRSGIGHLERP